MQFDLISTESAQEIMNQAKLKPLIKSLPLEQAIGHRLAIDIHAQRDLPPYYRIMMDGIALPSHHLSLLQESGLFIKGSHCAGEPEPSSALDNNEAWEVMTGSICPDGCDVIIPYEQINFSDSNNHKRTVHLNNDAPILNSDCCSSASVEHLEKSRYIHIKGSDYQQGDLLLATGTFINSTHIAVLASEGYTHVSVISSPSICLISTGDELVPVNTSHNQLQAYQIRRSNQPMLESLLTQLLPQSSIESLHLPDDATVIEQQLAQQLQTVDIIIITGGISKGKKDWIRSCLETLIGQPTFHGIAQRPGKPLAFWAPQDNKHQTTVLALPGNPVSVITCFHEYALGLLQDYLPTHISKTPIYASLTEDFSFKPSLTCFLPVTIELDLSSHQYLVNPKSVNNSGDFASLSRSTGYIQLPYEAKELTTFKKGMLVKYTPWL